MPKQQFTVEIDLPAAQSAAVRALGDRAVADALPIVAAIAVREWLEWLVADDRPASLTEVSKRRVKALVDGGLLPQIPTAPVIAQRTRLTLGQARYIISTLALEDPAATSAVREGFIGRLRAAIVKFGIANPDTLDGDGIKAIIGKPGEVVLDVPRAEADLASATHEELLNARFSASNQLQIQAFEPPKRKKWNESYLHLSMRPHVAIAILQRLLKADAP